MPLTLKNEQQKNILNNSKTTNPILHDRTVVLDKDRVREIIAKRAAKEFKDGDVVTLGIGLPTAVANYIPKGMEIWFQSESGLLGQGHDKEENQRDRKVVNAGGIDVHHVEGASFYDSQMAFTMMRGGHIDATVLGALQVDSDGSLASWIIPGKFTPGIGGSMDLVVGAKKVIVAMEHTSKGQIKIVDKCTLPLTAYKEVDLIITERCVFEVGKDGLILTEINPMFTIDDIKKVTTARFTVSENLKHMDIN